LEDLAPFLVLGIVALFGVMIFFMIRTEKRERARKSQLARELGFTLIEVTSALTARISQLYEKKWGKTNFELRNVSRKIIPDGEMYLFDLVDTAGEDDTFTEDQAIAVVSRYLQLPEFTIFPQLDIEAAGSKIANTLLRWVISKAGDPIDFPDHPAFEERYLVSSADEAGTRQFLDDRKLHMLAQVQFLGIHAGGDLFVLSKFDLTGKGRKREDLSKKVTQAMDVFQIFTD
jgi:hypothetical protein